LHDVGGGDYIPLNSVMVDEKKLRL
jgi:hypothetical protein